MSVAAQFWRIEWEKMPWFVLQMREDDGHWQDIGHFQAANFRAALDWQRSFIKKGGMLKHRSRVRPSGRPVITRGF